MEATNEALLITGIWTEWWNLLAGNVNCWGACSDLDLVADCNGGAVFAEESRFELKWWLLGRTKFSDCCHGEC